METQDGSNGSLRVASFSCYLDKAKESLVHRVSAQDHNNMTIKFSAAAAASGLRVDSLSRASDHNLLFQVPAPVPDPTAAFSFSHQSAEIGVFGADRYFNTRKLQYPTAAAPPRRAATTSGSGSESESSVATSWNSQSTLLRSNQSIQLKQKKAAAAAVVTAARLFTGFNCRTPCFGNKSVQISEFVAAPAKNQLIEKIEESRRSIEVFGSSRKIRVSKGGNDVATNMERKLSMLTWDAIPVAGSSNLPTSTVGSSSGGGGGGGGGDGAESDGSSDLFEIEDVSGSIYSVLEGVDDDDDDDEPSCVMSPATSLYAPSEASIQWSVVTASAADFSSALSEFDSVSVTAAAAAKPRANSNQGQKSRPSHGLLGCKSVKAVDVANENVCVKVKNKTLIN
ncbi:protein PHYTOCHROME KINASE SUBSTRATE 3-like [Salvia hispanica]|uniref:protein PHYTOCHROME KINASE SUBSTRATE 3-like n=1 Tax=Salvia hispanica TaxID=49212 RepID=UPI00200929C2|nr:protein PHYTOCHROME KINASE SUBSTRATE 3-like [Salvia hispanica]